MDELLRMAAERATHYLDTLAERRVAPAPESVARLNQLDQPLPAESANPAEVLAELDRIASPATFASAGPRYFGFVTGGTLPAALAANWLAGAWDQNAAFTTMSPVAAALEVVAQRWLLDIFGLPETCATAFVTGATMANFSALAAARHAVLARLGWNVEADGLFGAPPVAVIAGEEVHQSVIKALGMLGFGRQRVVRVPVDGQGRIQADALPAIKEPAIVCVQVGNVNTGSSDPVREICAWAHAAGAWVHVDGAFGLWAAAAPQRAYLVDCTSEADSWATDAHKWLNVPYDSGLAIVRDAAALHAAMSVSADYLPVSAVRQPAHFTPELSRRGRGIEVWAALRSLGRSGLADLVERNCRYAGRFAGGLRKAGYSILNEVVLNQVLVSFGDSETTRNVIAGVQAEGTCWCGGTVWQGQTAMRISVSSWATTEADVDRSIEAIVRVAHQVRSSGTPA